MKCFRIPKIDSVASQLGLPLYVVSEDAYSGQCESSSKCILRAICLRLMEPLQTVNNDLLTKKKK